MTLEDTWNEKKCKEIIKALEQEPCDYAISRQAVDEMIKAEMPERGMWEIEGDKEKETVCEVCVDLIQKLSALPPVTPQYTDAEIQKMQEMEQAEIQKAYELGKAEMQQAVEDAIYDYSRSCDVNYAQIMEYIDKISPVTVDQKTGHWIACSERLPEEKGYYLTTTIYGEVYCDYWTGENFDRTEMVISWQRLPEPYKVETT